MSSRCPYCGVELNVGRGKPGRHAARCAGCNKRFGVIVPEDAGEPMVTVALDADVGPDEETVSDSVRKTARREGPVEKLRAVEATVSYAPAEGTRVANAIQPAEPGPYAATRVSVPGFPRRLGGYEIRKELGRGGMGAVYLARQVSLDRNVALKVMKPEWTRNAQFLARFTREAFAAAQLVHHNMVQIYDIGSDRGVHYFTMEFVQGSSLGEVAKREGRLDPRAAAGHVLQAARGLKFAHDHGIIHRDIKPDNLMLNAQGIVKVADLGLVKTPEADISPGATPAGAGGLSSKMTVAGMTMGTPLYMAPEQAMDAANVDARADIYSLGCTFYVLVTGQPPFEGKTAQEVMSKHATARVVPPEMMTEGVPKLLSAIITRMVAKKPEDRYQDMGEVVGALEQFLGVESAGQFAPRQEHAALLEECAAAYNDAPAAGLRRRLTVGFAILCTLAAVLSAWFGWPLVAAGAVGLGLLTGLFHFAVHGLARKTVLFTKFRQLALGGSLADSAAWVLVGAVFAGMLWLLGLQWAFLVLCAAALALALGLHFLVDRKAGLQRGEPLGQVRELLRDMRLRGLGEDALRQFVCHYGSERWEPLYEALFGYEAKLQARKESGKGEAGRGARGQGRERVPGRGGGQAGRRGDARPGRDDEGERH